MIDPRFILSGIIIGFIIAALPGPIGLLCLKRTLNEGRIVGFVCGLGVTTADGIYSLIAGFGLTAISDLLLFNTKWLQIVGGIFLCLIGLRIIISRPSVNVTRITGKGLISAYGSTFLLTLSNPMTILLFAVIMAGLGIGSQVTGYGNSMALVMGICIGSLIWWTILSYGGGFFQKYITPWGLTWINRISGMIFCLFGFFSLIRAYS